MLADVGTLCHDQIEPLALQRSHFGSILYQGGASAAGQRTITVRLADCQQEKLRATDLLNRMYSVRGYGSHHHLPATEHCVTFTASADDCVLGTLTLRVDSLSGLTADDTFRTEIDSFRRVAGTELCELTRFAFDPSTRSRPVLASLFHIIFIYGSRRYGCTDLLIEVNPRHVRFYEAMLGFKRLGPVKTNNSVHAPAQLMWLEVAEIRRRIEQQAGDLTREGHSLYRYFFSREEERAILAGVAALLGNDRMLTKAA